VESGVEAGADLVSKGVQAGVHAVSKAVDIVFFDGHPQGQDPHQIYQWFHDGKGTGSYQGKETDLGSLTTSFGGYQDHVKNATAALQAGWHGSASDAAQQAFAPLAAGAQQLETHASSAHGAFGSQIGSFNGTKATVVQVPQNPPSGPGLAHVLAPLSPSNLTADVAVYAYQQGMHTNQDAYNGYGGQTAPQASSMPQNGQTTQPGDPNTTITPGNVDGVSPPPGVPSTPGNSGHNPGSTGHAGWGDSRVAVPPSPGAPGDGAAPGGSTGTTNQSSAVGVPLPGHGGAVPGDYTRPAAASAGAGGAGFGGSGGPGGADHAAGAGGLGGFAGFGPMGGAGSAGGRFGASGGAGGGRFGSGAGSAAGRPGAAGPSSGQSGAGARSAAGGLGAEGASAATRAGGRSTTGAAGAAGMGGAAGRGGKQEDDAEHRSAAYLQGDRSTELVGDLPLVAPPVIGD
jgi:hypothetical protein